MKRIKLIGLSFIMVCAVSAVAAASALAAPEFKAASYPVEWKGTATNIHAFSGGGVVIACREATFNTNEELGNDPVAEAKNPTANSPALVTHPIYKNCQGSLAAGTFEVEVKSKFCNFRMHAVKPGEQTGIWDVVCEKLTMVGEIEEKSKIVKGLSSTAHLEAGFTVRGSHIPAGTEVERVINEHEVELSGPPVGGVGTKTVNESLTFQSPGIRLVFLGLMPRRCTITVFPQSLKGVEYKNEPKAGTAEQEVTTAIEINELKAKATSACGLAVGEAEFKDEYRAGKIGSPIETAEIEPPGHPADVVFKGLTVPGAAPDAIEVGINESPTVTNVEPHIGPAAGGTSVTVTGTNFTGESVVRFGATTAASVTVNSGTSITAVSPAGTGTVDVTVTTAGGTSATSEADRFTYGPTVTRVEPNHGSPSGGSTVTITGTGFSGTTTVRFGSTNAARFTVNSATSITAVSPKARGAETVDLTVTTPAGTSPTSPADQFTYSTK
jgi:hypothetical protein